MDASNEQIKSILDEEYLSLKRYKHKQNAQILYNIIKFKAQYNMVNYHRSMYIDAKMFLKSYISAADNQDFGYDEINFAKIKNIIMLMPIDKRLSLLYTTRRYYTINGYNTDTISKEICTQKIKYEWRKGKYLNCFLLKVGNDFCGLLLGFFIYAIITMLILLPAPYKQMAFFNVKFKVYSPHPILNYPLNALCLITGNSSISPSLVPNGIKGVIIYIIGVLFWYVLVINFLFKKIENYMYKFL